MDREGSRGQKWRCSRLEVCCAGDPIIGVRWVLGFACNRPFVGNWGAFRSAEGDTVVGVARIADARATDQASALGFFLRRRATAPTRPAPEIIMTQTPGSGTALATGGEASVKLPETVAPAPPV